MCRKVGTIWYDSQRYARGASATFEIGRGGVLKLLAVLICVFVFNGCSAEKELSSLQRSRQMLEQSRGCAFDADITAQYPDRVYRFTLQCVSDGEGFRFQVKEPESIRGIAGSIEEKGGNLIFDDCLLAFPLLADGELSPVTAPWLFLQSLKRGLVRLASKTEDGVCISFEDVFRGETVLSEVSLTMDGTPLSCELFWNGERILLLQFTDFRYL